MLTKTTADGRCIRKPPERVRLFALATVPEWKICIYSKGGAETTTTATNIDSNIIYAHDMLSHVVSATGKFGDGMRQNKLLQTTGTYATNWVETVEVIQAKDKRIFHHVFCGTRLWFH